MDTNEPQPSSLHAIVASAVERQAGEQRALTEELRELRETISTNSANTEALTQALLDLNAGIQEQYRALEERLASLANGLVGGLREMAATQQKALESLGKALSTATTKGSQELRDEVREGLGGMRQRLGEVERNLSETVDLTAYLRDQADDLDRVLAALGDVPRKLEGVVAQALRRALTVRAGLLREAEKALEQAFGPVDARLRDVARELTAAREGLSEAGARDDDRVAHLARAQEDLLARMDDVVAYVADAEDDRLRRERSLAEAIDRLAKGQAPEATRGLREASAGAKSRRAAKTAAKTAKTPAAAPKRVSAKKKAPKVSAKRNGGKATSGGARRTYIPV